MPLCLSFQAVMPSDPQSGTSQDKIRGNISLRARQLLTNTARTFGRLNESYSVPVFGASINKSFVVTEAWIQSKREEEKQKEALIVIELDLTDDMTNRNNSIHGGCSAYIIDCATTLALAVYSLDVEGNSFVGVSQSLTVTYHSPAVAGDKLKIVSHTVAGGARAKTARCEIWNVTHHRMVAAGIHIKMEPSQAKL